MKLNLITLSTVKTMLGLSVTTYDSALTAMIPVVSSDVRRILNNNFDRLIEASFNSSAATAIFFIDGAASYYDNIIFAAGQVVYSPYIADDTYITGFDPDTNKYSLSSTPTATGDYVYPTVTIAQWPAISKMIWYRVSKKNTTDIETERLSSYTIGPVSKTYSQSEINKQWDYPQALIDDLGVPFCKVG